MGNKWVSMHLYYDSEIVVCAYPIYDLIPLSSSSSSRCPPRSFRWGTLATLALGPKFTVTCPAPASLLLGLRVIVCKCSRPHGSPGTSPTWTQPTWIAACLCSKSSRWRSAWASCRLYVGLCFARSVLGPTRASWPGKAPTSRSQLPPPPSLYHTPTAAFPQATASCGDPRPKHRCSSGDRGSWRGSTGEWLRRKVCV